MARGRSVTTATTERLPVTKIHRRCPAGPPRTLSVISTRSARNGPAGVEAPKRTGTVRRRPRGPGGDEHRSWSPAARIRTADGHLPIFSVHTVREPSLLARTPPPCHSRANIRHRAGIHHAGSAAGGRRRSLLAVTDTLAFTSIPVVDLRRWHAGDADRAALADEVRADLPRGRLLPPRRPRRRPTSFVDDYFDAAAGVLRPARGRPRRGSTRRGRRTSGAGSASAPSSPTTAPTTASSSTSRPSTRRTRPTSSRRTCASTGPNQWLPDDVLPGLPRRSSTSCSARLGAVADELMEVLSVGLGLEPDHLARRVRRAAAVVRQADPATRRRRPARPASTPTTTPASSPC